MHLRTKPDGHKFRRQHPIRNYIADFYCHSLKLIIEVDGPIHDLEENKKADMERQHNLQAEGLRVIRFTNDEVRMNMERVIEQINTIINEHIRTNTVD
jgi:very-short-patch-repair endonuclease